MGYQFLSNFKSNNNAPAFTLAMDEGVIFKNGNASGLFESCPTYTPTEEFVIPEGTLNCSAMFSRCNNFNQPVVIPDGVENVSNMFASCINFDQEMYIPEYTQGINIFYGCYNLNSYIEFDDNIHTMTNTFRHCHNFNYPIPLPSNLKNMSYTFANCNNFNQNIYIPDGVVNMIGTFASCENFDQSLYIPDSVISMNSTFAGCIKLTQSIPLPSNLVSATSCFSRCYNFNQYVELPGGLITAGSMFSGCTNFDQPITLPDGIESITGMFSSCTKFNQPLTIPDSVKGLSGFVQDCPNFNQPVNLYLPQCRGATNAFLNCVNFGYPVSLGPLCNEARNMCARTKVRTVTLTANHYSYSYLVGIFNTIWNDYHMVGGLRPSTYDFNNSEWIIGDVLHHLIMPRNATIYNSIYRQNYSATVIGSQGWIEPIFGAMWYDLNGRITQPTSYNSYNADPYFKNNSGASILYAMPYNSETGNCVAMYYDWANSTYNAETEQMDTPKYACVISLV